MKAGHLLAGCVLLLATASAASAQDSDRTFVAEPVPGSQTAPTGGYFLLEAEPGEQIQQSVGLRNDSAGQLELRLAAVDATTGQLGGVSYALPDERPSRTGAWITLERSTVTLGPGASAVVSFTVAVPADATTGQHLAGLSIAAPTAAGDSAEAGEGEAGASIDVQTRHVIAVQVDLPGPAEPELVVEGVMPAARPDGLYLEIAIENRGRGLTKATGAITVGDEFEREFDVDTFVPGTAIAYPIKWSTDANDGEHEAVVELRYGDEVARWDGTFTVGEEVRDELEERQVTPPSEENDGDSDIPMGLMVGGALAGGLLVAGGGYRFARLRRPRGKHAMPRGRARRRTVGR